ncbi:2Fe-2S iron-sulfur cluster-binding protein [Hymenobacter terrestris]|uniref:2Fe-2S iron-sulfur cluster binding domain-containing protein n=1 Tax=Hymenobacter terrestris TaxID=2748310 RepID=A0ABX2QAA4_9BACT|nr:2Fe-2S iron-sulfur cluster-binding protein [Hymenobacter terrestris]NVO86624.1 2Fe-2S iron-sulfur cluster binding domain-containing protein [Hymenobacter terrestris]
MNQAPIPQAGDLAPDCVLPNGTRLLDLRGRPVILAFASDTWDPTLAHQSALFARLSADFGSAGAAFVDIASDEWQALDCRGALAERFGVAGQRALILLDEHGVVRWRTVVAPGQELRSGQVLAALEALNPATAPAAGPEAVAFQLSRRTFVTATLAAAALLLLPGCGSSESDQDSADEQAAATASDTVAVALTINGQAHRLTLDPRVALLDALRENLHLTGTKKGCDHGQCGACTVHLDGQSALACLTLAVMAQGKEITTIEGLAKGEELHPLQAAFLMHDAFQCGYCTPGQLMAATALLQDKTMDTGSGVEIREAMSGNLCRCAAYPNIIAAIQDVQRA